MPTYNGPSQFADVYNVTYGTTTVYAVTGIKIERDETYLKGTTNNVPGIVSAHAVMNVWRVSLDTEDIAAGEVLNASTGAANLVFTWIAASIQNTTSPLANQTVTVKNVIWEKKALDPATKGFGKYGMSGFIIFPADGTDPISFTTAT